MVKKKHQVSFYAFAWKTCFRKFLCFRMKNLPDVSFWPQNSEKSNITKTGSFLSKMYKMYEIVQKCTKCTKYSKLCWCTKYCESPHLHNKILCITTFTQIVMYFTLHLKIVKIHKILCIAQITLYCTQKYCEPLQLHKLYCIVHKL